METLEASKAAERASSGCVPLGFLDAVRFSTLAALGHFSLRLAAKEFVLSVASLCIAFSRLVLFLVVTW